MVVVPNSAAIPTNSCLQISVSGGSGDFDYAISSSAPIGSIDSSGLYTSGSNEGIESIQVYDNLAEEAVVVQVTVDSNAALKTSAKQYILPVGSRQDLGLTGGSGSISLGSEASFVHLEDGILVADSPGSALVSLNDTQVFCPGLTSGMSSQVTVTVVDAIDSLSLIHI